MYFALLGDTPEQHNDWPGKVSTTRRTIGKKGYGHLGRGALG
jgi:hypothetical protein